MTTDNDWQLQERETRQRTARTLEHEGLSARLTASDADSKHYGNEPWRGAFAAIDLRINVQMKGSTMETAQRALDQAVPHVEALLGIMARCKEGKPLSQMESDDVAFKLSPTHFDALVKLVSAAEAVPPGVVRELRGILENAAQVRAVRAHTTGSR